MFPISSIITIILSTSALAATSVPVCTTPTHPPNDAEISLSMNTVNYMAVKWGHAVINVKWTDVPVYITSESIVTKPEPDNHGAILLTLRQGVTIDFTFQDDIMDCARRTFQRCLERFGPNKMGGWVMTRDRKSLNLSFVDPHSPLGTDSSTGLPTVLKS